MGWFLMILVAAFGLSGISRADETKEKPNCKLTVQTFFKSGKKKVSIDEIHTPTRMVCQAEAQIRRLAVEEDPEEVDNTKVVFSWRDVQ